MEIRKKYNIFKKSKGKNNNAGITLVALVVTIIVLIVLAGVSINLILGDNGIITKAQAAKRVQEIAEIKSDIQLDIMAKEAEVLANRNKITTAQIEAILGKYGTVNKDGEAIVSITPTGKDYEIPFNEIYGGSLGSNTPVTPQEPEGPTVPTTVEQAKADYVVGKTPVLDSLNNTVMIPNGFKVSAESGANINEGIVVEDKAGNEFVWIPVELGEGETFESKYPRTKFSNNAPTSDLSSSYTEPYTSGYDGEDDEYDAMVASVNLNKGFYVGRYEVGFEGETKKSTYTSYTTDPTQEQIEAETAKLVVQKDAQIYTYVPWGSAMNDITAHNKGTTDSPKYVIGAVELAQNFDNVNNYSGVTSTLIYGIQWDMVMRYVADANHNVSDSTNWGNYKNYSSTTGDTSTPSGSLQTAGKNVNWQAKKIYDLAGNASERTMESYSSNGRVCRGRLLQ